VKLVNRLLKLVAGDPTAVKLPALSGKKAWCQLESAGRENAEVAEYPTGLLMKKARRIERGCVPKLARSIPMPVIPAQL
jgi:hypothetical protein